MDTFQILILIGRPAAGKSEIIDFLTHTKARELQRRFHLAQLDILDDFPMLWTWFEEDRLLSKKLGQPRLHTDEQGYFKYYYLWDLLVERLNLEYQKLQRDTAGYHEKFTTIIEFSRGSEHGGYTQAFQHLSDTILDRAGVVYVNVPFEESLRKNRRRFNPERPDSILEHSLPDERLKRLYGHDDWETFCAGDPEYLTINSKSIPYVAFENADDVTTDRPEELAARLETTLGRLWELEQKRTKE